MWREINEDHDLDKLVILQQSSPWLCQAVMPTNKLKRVLATKEDSHCYLYENPKNEFSAYCMYKYNAKYDSMYIFQWHVFYNFDKPLDIKNPNDIDRINEIVNISADITKIIIERHGKKSTRRFAPAIDKAIGWDKIREIYTEKGIKITDKENYREYELI